MRLIVLPVLGCLALCLLSASALQAQPTVAPAALPAASSAAQPLADPAAYVVQQFGSTFKVDPKVPPQFGDLDGDGNEDLVLVGSSSTPLLSQEMLGFRVEDPYDGYFGTGDVKITSQFTLHFDGSARCILIVFGWRLPPPPPERKSKLPTKFVLINTPFETLSIPAAKLRLNKKKKDVQALETVDRTSLHALIFWDGKRWRWSGQGMDGDEPLMPKPN